MRYNNQGLMLESLDFSKTGNILSIIFFGAIIILITINIFTNSETKESVFAALTLVGAASLFVLFIFGNVFSKDEKVYFTFGFIAGNIFIFLSLLSVTLTHNKKLRPARKVFFTVFSLAVIIFIIFLQIYNYKDDSAEYLNGIDTTERIADAGIIFGAADWGGNRPSPVLRERINKGYEIYKAGLVPLLVVTGSGSPQELSESEVARNELIKYGVQEKDLIVEKVTFSTFEQITFVRDNLYTRRNWDRIVVVSDDYHLYRIKEICKFNDMDAITISSDTPLSTQGGILFCMKESVAVLMYWVLGFG